MAALFARQLFLSISLKIMRKLNYAKNLCPTKAFSFI